MCCNQHLKHPVAESTESEHATKHIIGKVILPVEEMDPESQFSLSLCFTKYFHTPGFGR